MLTDANSQATEQIDQQNQQGRYRVAADKFRRTVHRTEEVRLLGQFSTALTRSVLVNHACIQISINRHLLSGHRIQGESGVDFRDAACALGDHKEVHDHQNRKNDKADHVVSADDKLAKGRDYFSCGVVAFMTAHQNHPGRRHIERQAQHRGKQQHRRERRELEGLAHLDGDHDDQHTRGDIEGKQNIQEHGVQRNNQHTHDQQHQSRNAQVIEVELG